MSKPLSAANIAICKQALSALARLEPDGISRDTLLDLAQSAVGRLLTTREKDAAFFELKDREWITPHINPIIGTETWSITANGHNALACM